MVERYIAGKGSQSVASALVAFCLNEDGPDGQKLKAHLREGVISVDLIRAESASAILISKRRGVTKDNAVKLALSGMLQLSRNNIKLIPQDDELISKAFEMSESMALAIYDSLYLSREEDECEPPLERRRSGKGQREV